MASIALLYVGIARKQECSSDGALDDTSLLVEVTSVVSRKRDVSITGTQHGNRAGPRESMQCKRDVPTIVDIGQTGCVGSMVRVRACNPMPLVAIRPKHFVF